MYLILSDANGNATPKMFHNGVNVIGLRVAEEDPTKNVQWRRSDREDTTEKIRRRRFVGEDTTEKIRLKRSTGQNSTEKIRLRRSVRQDLQEKWLTPEPTMVLIPCEMREEKNTFLY